MMHPLFHGKPSHPSQLSRSGVEPRCEGFGEGVDGEQNLHSYPSQIRTSSVKVFPANKNLHGVLRLFVKV